MDSLISRKPFLERTRKSTNFHVVSLQQERKVRGPIAVNVISTRSGLELVRIVLSAIAWVQRVKLSSDNSEFDCEVWQIQRGHFGPFPCWKSPQVAAASSAASCRCEMTKLRPTLMGRVMIQINFSHFN